MKNLIKILFSRNKKAKEFDGNTPNRDNTNSAMYNQKDIQIGDWCSLYPSSFQVHPEDRELWKNYPYKNQFHKCLNIENGYYTIRFSGISIRLLKNAIIKRNEPEYYPFELINYITTKGKFEFGRIIAYVGYYKPNIERAYTIKVKDKIKSNRYRAARLSKSSIPYDRVEFNEKLSKTISYILRHKPDEFNIILDENGWTDLDVLIENISSREKYFNELSFYDVSLMIDHSKKERHQIKPIKKEHEKKWLGHYYIWRIRAKYGHSLESKMNYGINEPPEVLYHGTDSKVVEVIMKNGLKPMTRAYVHLSTDKDTAIKVGLRKSKQMTILRILAKEAFNLGQKFYKVDSNIWLTDELNSKFVKKEHDH